MNVLVTGSTSLKMINNIRQPLKNLPISKIISFDREIGVDKIIQPLIKEFKCEYSQVSPFSKDIKTYRDNLKFIFKQVDSVFLFWDGKSKEVKYIGKLCDRMNMNYQIIKIKE